MKTELNAKDTARTLGVCDKTLRLWIKSGKLQPVQGTGGQGRALAFNVAEVEASRIRHAGVADADFLARIAYAFQLKRDTPACRWFPWFESRMLWKWHKSEKKIKVKLGWRAQSDNVRVVRDNCFPPLAEVPKRLTTWASRLGRVLTSDEMDYLAAVFVVVAYPWRKYDPLDEKWALMRSLEITGQHNRDHENILEDAYDSGDAGSLRSLIEDREDCSGKGHVGILKELQIGDEETEKKYAHPGLLSASRKQAADRKEQGRGNPSGARVATLLCIHRYQATRLLRRIMEKIGPHEMVELVKILGLSRIPRIWQGEYCYNQTKRRRFSWAKATQRSRADRLIDTECPGCGEKISAMAEKCSECGRLL